MEINSWFVFEVFDEVAGQIARTRFRSGGSKLHLYNSVHHLVVGSLQNYAIT